MASAAARRIAAVAAIAAASDAGSPVAGFSEADFELRADLAMRRWDSWSRRNSRPPSHADRVEDLAKGPRDRFETDPRLTGPLMEDYRHLAGQIAAAWMVTP